MSAIGRLVVKVDKITGEILDEYKSVYKAIKATGNKSIRCICRKKLLCKTPYFFRYKDDYNNREMFTNKENKPIAVFKKNRLLFVAFSTMQASRIINYAIYTIDAAARENNNLSNYRIIKLDYIGALYDICNKNWELNHGY